MPAKTTDNLKLSVNNIFRPESITLLRIATLKTIAKIISMLEKFKRDYYSYNNNKILRV